MRVSRFLTGLMIFLLLSPALKAQSTYAYAVSFRDKQGSSGSISNPSTFLSPRAIARRNTQNISIDSTDLPVSEAYVDSVLTLTNGLLHLTSKWLNLCVIILTDSTQIDNIQNKPFVSDIKYVAYYSGPHPVHPDPNANNLTEKKAPPLFKTTGSATYFGASYPQISLVKGDCMQSQGYQGQGKLITVLDAGFIGTDTISAFDSLFLTNRILDTHNFTENNNIVYSYASHGTSVLSTMAANVPTVYVGTAPEASYALYVTEDGNSEQPVELYNLVAGTERADSLGTDVITCSLGYDFFDAPFGNNYYNFSTDFDGKTTVGAKAVNFATKKGILFVSSAGNDALTFWQKILTPGDADSALTIGAVDLNGNPFNQSGFGPNAAGQTKPDVCAVGVSASVYNEVGQIVGEDGTSFATPQIAGLAACLWQAAGNVSPHAIRVAIDSSANFRSNPGTQIGYGIPDFCNAQQLLGVKDTPNSPFGEEWLKVWPNPLTGSYINVHLYLNSAQAVSFRLVDISGREVFSENMNLIKGYHTNITLNIPNNLPRGMYILKALSSTQNEVVKLEKL